MQKPIIYHIPVCPFRQRTEILLALKGHPDAVEFRVVDITKPRDPQLLQKTRGTTALPVMELADRQIIKESLVILSYLDETIAGGLQRRSDPYEHAIEQMLIAKEGPFVSAGYRLVMNQDRNARQSLVDGLLKGLRRDQRLPRRAQSAGRLPVPRVRACRSRVHADIYAILVPRILRGVRTARWAGS